MQDLPHLVYIEISLGQLTKHSKNLVDKGTALSGSIFGVSGPESYRNRRLCAGCLIGPSPLVICGHVLLNEVHRGTPHRLQFSQPSLQLIKLLLDLGNTTPRVRNVLI